MKKSTKKTINYLSQWIGHEIIRTKPTCNGDWSYTHDIILLVGFTPDGCIIFTEDNKKGVLPFYFTDRNWITKKKAMRAKNNQLNQWKGKKIKRIHPTSTFGDKTYMSESVTLVSASKYHLVVMLNRVGHEGKKKILRSDYANAEDWSLAE